MTTEQKRPIYIFDGLCTYLRAFSAYPQLNANGEQAGGYIGFLKSLQRICREFQPSSVYIAWEGGGSSRRRSLYPDYKANRRPVKLNRFYEDDIPETDENKHQQLVTLISLLKNVPVCQLYVPDCEGDDVVSYLCTGPFKNEEKVIVSADKDMYQLIDDKTKLYSLYRKTFITQELLFEEYRIKTHNFALAKCLCGDVSDNIPGVKGVGFKTVAKKFPLLGTDENVILQDVISYAESHSDERVGYKRVVESKDLVKRNWDLVYLDDSMLSANQINKIEHSLNTFVPSVNRVGLTKALIREGINDFDVASFFNDLICIDTSTEKK